jgi:hypothetical protein
MGIEPTAQAWEAWVLPLYDARAVGLIVVAPLQGSKSAARKEKAPCGAFPIATAVDRKLRKPSNSLAAPSSGRSRPRSIETPRE